jgi:hypothetical protein
MDDGDIRDYLNLIDFDGKIGSLHLSGVVRLSLLVWLDLRFGCAVFHVFSC